MKNNIANKLVRQQKFGTNNLTYSYQLNINMNLIY